MPVVVRPATQADIADMVRIEEASFSDPWSLDSFTVALDSDRMRVLVAEVGDEAGVGGGHATGSDAVSQIVVDGESALLGFVIALMMGTEAEIADLAVKASARGAGVGGDLMDHIVRDLGTSGVETLYLEVRESNGAARALYASQGFRQVGRRSRYYTLPLEDALILRRDLQPG